jgi:hypothetical protein
LGKQIGIEGENRRIGMEGEQRRIGMEGEQRRIGMEGEQRRIGMEPVVEKDFNIDEFDFEYSDVFHDANQHELEPNNANR